MTLNDPDVRRQIARMRWKQREMSKNGKLLTQWEPGTYRDSANTDIARNWMRLYDWMPPSQMRELA